MDGGRSDDRRAIPERDRSDEWGSVIDDIASMKKLSVPSGGVGFSGQSVGGGLAIERHPVASLDPVRGYVPVAEI